MTDPIAHDVHDGEKQIALLIERRAAAAPDPAEASSSWRESVQRFHEAAAERRRAWAAHHSDLARLHTKLAAEHEQKAAQLANSKRQVQAEGVTGNGRGAGGAVLSG